VAAGVRFPRPWFPASAPTCTTASTTRRRARHRRGRRDACARVARASLENSVIRRFAARSSSVGPRVPAGIIVGTAGAVRSGELHRRGSKAIDMSIDEGQFVTIGGVDQWVTMRGQDAVNPLLLLIGGPGAAFSSMARFFAPWERDFTLVQWDQPGAGATQAKNGA